MSQDKLCSDCGVNPGLEHLDGCDVARCFETGFQRLLCLGEDVGHDCGRDVWTGDWPGSAECREFGWYCYFDPDSGRWVQISEDVIDTFRRECPDVMIQEDLGRLYSDAEWDRERGRFVQWWRA